MADLLKKLQKVHQNQQRHLHNRQQMQMQAFLAKHRSAYKEAESEQARAVLLTTYVQTLSQLKQTYALRQKRLLDRQAKQRENLILKAVGPTEFERRQRMKTARSIIKTYAKASSGLSLALYF